MRRTQIYFPEAQLNELKDLAAAQHVSLSEIIRRRLSDVTQTSGVQPQPKPKYRNSGEALMAMAKEAEARGVKGPRDLATNMDQYLYGGK